MESTVDAQRRIYRLKPETLPEVDAWLAPIRRFWSARVDVLERHLDHMAQSTLTKKDDKEKMKNTIDKLMMFSMAVSDMPKAKVFYAHKLGLKVATDYRNDDHWWVSLTFPEGGLLLLSPPHTKT